MNEDEIVEGYFDGRASDEAELDRRSNRSESYRLGWSNGRDDRLSKPRSSAAVIRGEGAAVAARDAEPRA